MSAHTSRVAEGSTAPWNQQQRVSLSRTSGSRDILRGEHNDDYYSNIWKPRSVRQGKGKRMGRAEVVDLEEECACLLEGIS
jgi:hypothetical protein